MKLLKMCVFAVAMMFMAQAYSQGPPPGGMEIDEDELVLVDIDSELVTSSLDDEWVLVVKPVVGADENGLLYGTPQIEWFLYDGNPEPQTYEFYTNPITVPDKNSNGTDIYYRLELWCMPYDSEAVFYYSHLVNPGQAGYTWYHTYPTPWE